MTFPFAVMPAPAGIPPLDEEIWADSDRTNSQWETNTGSTSNVYTACDSESDSDYVTLEIPVLNGTRTLAFNLQDPSTDPATTQQVYAQIRASFDEPILALPNNPTLEIRIDENNTQRAQEPAVQLSTSPADYTCFMTESEIGNVGNWNNLQVEMVFSSTMNTGADEEAQFLVYEARVIFSP